MNDAVSTSRDGDLLIIMVNNPPVNALGQAVRAGLQQAALDLEADDALRAGVIVCAGRTFMAGADIREFGKPPLPPSLPDVVSVLENLKKPVIAAIHGTALGGGLEVALGCHGRIAVPSAKIGLPEVKLGLLPGAGGTQRLPRLAGVENALDAMLTGRHVTALEAVKWGAIDEITDGDLLEAAKTAARSAALRPTGAIPVDSAGADAAIAAAKAMAARRLRGQFAPGQIIACVEAALAGSLEDGIATERQRFQDCMAHPQSAAMRHYFFAERQISRVPGVDKETPRRTVKTFGVIGAGTMGGGIAMACANAGFEVRLLEMTDAALDTGLSLIRKNYDATAAKGRISVDDVEDRMARIAGTLDYGDLADCDVIIEAVFERMDVKKEVFAKIDAVAKDGAILATNTSYLDIDEIAAATSRPGDVVGLHFFSPANVMKLLEIVRGKDTSADVLATAMDCARSLGKVGVVAGNCHGFIGNRMLRGYGREAALMVVEGAAPEQVDGAMTGFGMAMGPLAVSDLAGLDIGYMTRQSIGRGAYDTRAYDWIDQLVEAGRKGQKTGKGIYLYEPGSRKAIPDPEVTAIIGKAAEVAQIHRRDIREEEIVERCMLALVNEGAAILEEGIALRASDIDIVYANGYGFPVFQGGPMHWADAKGLDWVAARLSALAEATPANWTVSPLILKLASDGRNFADHDRRP